MNSIHELRHFSLHLKNMRFSNGLDLAYCTNVHRGNTWEETFRSLEKYVLAVREKVAPGERFAIGLRLGADAARELSNPRTNPCVSKNGLKAKDCYVSPSTGSPTATFTANRLRKCTVPTGRRRNG